jgi:hypothetical protein
MRYDVELIICTTDHSWGTDYVEVVEEEVRSWENETPEFVAIDKYTKQFCKNKKENSPEIAYVGLYHIEEIEEERDETVDIKRV